MKQICLYSQPYEFGQIDRSWTSNICPFDYQNLKVGDIFIHADTRDGGINVYVCQVLKKEYIAVFDTLDITVDVLEVKNENRIKEFAKNYENKHSI